MILMANPVYKQVFHLMGFAIGSPVGTRHGIHIRMISEDFLKNLSGTRKILAPWLDSGRNIPQSHIVVRKNIPWIQYKSTLQHGWILIPLAADAWLHTRIELLLAMHDRHMEHKRFHKPGGECNTFLVLLCHSDCWFHIPKPSKEVL